MSRRKDPNLSASEEREVLKWTRKVRTEVLACRQYGHTWTEGLTVIYKIGGDYVKVLGCGRCGMRRKDATPIGEYGVRRRSYEAPPDYSRERGDGSSVRVPRWAIAEGVVGRSEVEEPTEDLLDWYYKRATSE